jgi:lipopolysaccharide/colanic/teichoic acid biosynthesis glycosyltransferase
VRRHEVKPGITGWAQVNGRNAISWEERFAYDVWYVEHASLALDIQILLLTLRRVISSEGVSPHDQLIMERFRGTRHKEAERK